jgi:hypothetical protein
MDSGLLVGSPLARVPFGFHVRSEDLARTKIDEKE